MSPGDPDYGRSGLTSYPTSDPWKDVITDANNQIRRLETRIKELELALIEIRGHAVRVEKGPPFRLPAIRDLVDEVVK